MINELAINVRRGTWKHYKAAYQVHEDAELFTSLQSEDQRSEIERHRRSEDWELKDQRIELSDPITPGSLSPVFSVYENLSRIAPDYTVTCQSENAKQLIQDNFSTFYGRKPLLEYVFDTTLWANKYDPNAWLVLEAMPVTENGVTTRMNLYPVLWGSDEIVDVQYDKQGQPKSITARQKFTDSKSKQYSEYRLYEAGMITHAVQVHAGMEALEGYTLVNWEQDGMKNIAFYVREFPNTTKRLPAICLGAYKGRKQGYFVTLYDEATPTLRKLIKLGNFNDVHETLHMFAEKFEYVKPCKAVNEQNMECVSGYYGGMRQAENVCHSCHGSGIAYVSSEQMTKQLRWEDGMTADQFVELSKLAYYLDRPLDLLREFAARIEVAERKVYSQTFNQDVQPKAQAGPDTATEVKINYDAQFNKVRRFTARVEDVMETMYISAFGYYDVTGDAEYKYPADYNFRSFDELIATFEQSKQVGGEIQNYVYDTLLKRVHQDSPAAYNEAKAYEKFKPFAGKTSEEIALIITRRAPSDYDVVLWEGWDKVQRNLTAIYDGLFHKLTFQAQQTAIDEQVELLRGQVVPVDAGGLVV